MPFVPPRPIVLLLQQEADLAWGLQGKGAAASEWNGLFPPPSFLPLRIKVQSFLFMVMR